MTKDRLRSFAVAVAVLACASLGIGPCNTERYEVRLKSRAFVPEAGVRAFLWSTRRHGVIQFYELPDSEDHDAIRAAGITLHDYLPNLAYTATLTRHVRPQLLKALNVRALFSLAPDDKLAPSILRGEAGERSWVAANVIVYPDLPELNDGAAVSASRPAPSGLRNVLPLQAKLRARALVVDTSSFFETLLVWVRRSELRRMASSEWVRWIEPVPEQGLDVDDTRGSMGIAALQDPPRSLDG